VVTCFIKSISNAIPRDPIGYRSALISRRSRVASHLSTWRMETDFNFSPQRFKFQRSCASYSTRSLNQNTRCKPQRHSKQLNANEMEIAVYWPRTETNSYPVQQHQLHFIRSLPRFHQTPTRDHDIFPGSILQEEGLGWAYRCPSFRAMLDFVSRH
jgi:hypothetical protein